MGRIVITGGVYSFDLEPNRLSATALQEELHLTLHVASPGNVGGVATLNSIFAGRSLSYRVGRSEERVVPGGNTAINFNWDEV